MNIRYISIILFLCTIIVSMVSCEGNEDDDADLNRFDRSAMLENMAQNIIIPAYNTLQVRVGALKSTAQAFTQNPTSESLTKLQNDWESAYKVWQHANAFNFGPAGEEGVRRDLIEEIGTFPVSVQKIESAINTDPNFNDFNRDARGFLTVEYLIYGLNATNDEIIQNFATENRKAFLVGAIEDIEQRVNMVLSGWNDGFATEFIQNAGTDVGSSTSALYNEFVKSFEAIKNFKLGLPLGRRPGQTNAEPQLVEAYYSGKSLVMIQEHLTAIENIWHGRNNTGIDGIGFREYLASVEGGEALIIATEAQMTVVKAALAAIPTQPSLAEQIVSAPTAADLLHTELQKHTRFYKSDMSSLLGIAITFSSGDGD